MMYIYEYKENCEPKQKIFESLCLALDYLFEDMELRSEIEPLTISDSKYVLIDYNDFIFKLRRNKF